MLPKQTTTHIMQQRKSAGQLKHKMRGCRNCEAENSKRPDFNGGGKHATQLLITLVGYKLKMVYIRTNVSNVALSTQPVDAAR